MRKRVSIFIASLVVVALAAIGYYTLVRPAGNSVGGTTNSAVGGSNGSSRGAASLGGKTLIVYFSQPETTNPNGMTQDEDNSAVVIDGKVLGNTQYMATVIQERTGGDIFRIEAQDPYPTDHDTLVDQASREQADEARPAIKGRLPDLSQYQTIFVGYPIWWSEMPMIMYSYFDQEDFSGKTIVPFNTHGGSGFSGTVQAIAQLEPNAAISQDGLTISRDDIQEAKPEIDEWLGRLGY